MSAGVRRRAGRDAGHAAGRAGWWGLDTANPLVAGTYGAARAAVDVALTTVDLVLGGERAAYGLCRPPGHHAARSMYGGYCFFNNAAIAAEAIVRATGERVAILDVDYHHGNGTPADLLAPRRRALRLDPRRPGAAVPVLPRPRRRDRRRARGAGENLNIPLPAGHRRRGLPRRRSTGRSRRSPPSPGSVVVVSLGFDTYGLDPIGDFALTTDGLPRVSAGGSAALGRRLVILQEGGYHRPSLGENARAWLRGAEGRPFEPLPAGGFGEHGSDR